MRDVSCDVIAKLTIRWICGRMPETDRVAYEEHLVCCPPCMLQMGKARIALTMLPEAADAEPSPALIENLVDIVRRRP